VGQRLIEINDHKFVEQCVCCERRERDREMERDSKGERMKRRTHLQRSGQMPKSIKRAQQLSKGMMTAVFRLSFFVLDECQVSARLIGGVVVGVVVEAIGLNGEATEF
jgi:hypothetical protein